MHTLYDSDSYLVNHLLPMTEQEDAAAQASPQPTLLRHGFEIVDKQAGRQVYLDGSWAELFQQRLLQWQRTTPTQEEVEATLSQYAELATVPLYLH